MWKYFIISSNLHSNYYLQYKPETFLTVFYKERGFRIGNKISYLDNNHQKDTYYYNDHKNKLTTKRKQSIQKKMKYKVMLQIEQYDIKIGITYRSGINLAHVEEGKFYMLYVNDFIQRITILKTSK